MMKKCHYAKLISSINLRASSDTTLLGSQKLWVVKMFNIAEGRIIAEFYFYALSSVRT